MPEVEDPRLLVGSNTADDAGIYQINDTDALVVTTDFFPPIVDNPYVFGQIAAANALSDVYAMGGRPVVCLNLLCFPYGKMPDDVMEKVLLGGQNKVSEAGAVIAGGHSIKDAELKYGLAVTGLVKIKDIKTNAGAMAGDKLIMTKSLGTGIISTAMKNNTASQAILDEAITQMVTLNKAPAEIVSKYRCSAITDVTGFGLIGHALEMAEASQVSMKLYSEKIQVIPGAIELAEANQLTGGGKDNIKVFGGRVRYEKPLSESMIHILHDPQTSGGLLLAVNSDDVPALMTELRIACRHCAVIGEVADGPSGIVLS